MGLAVPVAGMPSVSVSVMFPMAGSVAIAGMWWLFPPATGPYVGAMVFPPVFIYPHMAGTWGFHPHYGGPHRSHTHIYLRLAAVSATYK